MKDTIPLLPNDSTPPDPPSSQPPTPTPTRKTRLTNGAKTIATILVVATILAGFLALFASHHPGTGQSNAPQHSTPSSTFQDGSSGWFRIKTLATYQSAIYAIGGNNLYALQMDTGNELQHYHFDRAGWSPVIVNGVEYMDVERDQYDYVEAWQLTASSAKRLWSYQMICCSRQQLVVANGALYTFAGGSIGAIYALRASNGSVLWSVPTNGPDQSPMTVVNGVMYVGTRILPSNDSFYALNARTGKRIWSSKINGIVDTPVTFNGVVYITSGNDAVYALRASNGSLLWQARADYYLVGSPVVHNGVVYVGTGNNSVDAFRASDGTMLWHQRTNNLLHPMPRVPYRNIGVFVEVADNNAVYVGSEDGYMAALRASDGSLLWVHLSNGGIVESPSLLANGVVYVYSDSGYTNKSAIYALRTGDGTLLWSFPIGLMEPGLPSSPPASGGITPHLSGVPSFTRADVEQYLKTHSMKTLSGQPPTIVKILFITSQQASALMAGESVGLPNDALVCYVELHGPFSADGISRPPPRPGAKPATPAPIQNIQEVFDAETGNLLVWGFLG